MKRQILAWVLLLLLLWGAAAADTALSDYAGKRIAVQTGTISGEVAQAQIKDVKLKYFNTQTDALTALRAGKVDAFCTEESSIRFMQIENSDLVIEAQLDETTLAAVFPKTSEGQALCDQYSAFVEGLWADGTMAQIDSVWFGTDDAARTVLDYKNLPDTNGTLRMAVDTTLVPYAYVKDNHVVGYDVDIAARFCKANGYRLEVKAMTFDGILPAVKTGKCDFAACGITVTEERAESVLFSAGTYRGGTVLATSKDAAPVARGVYASLDALDSKRIGVQTGTLYDKIVLDRLPNASIDYFNSYPDMAAALEANKIDGFPGDEPVLRMMAGDDPALVVLDENMQSFEFGFVIEKSQKGDALAAEMNDWIARAQASGELDEIYARWVEGPESEKIMPDYAAFPATKGTLRFGTEGAYAPMNYFRGKELVGMEVELAARFCEDCGYGFKPEAMNFDGILPAVQSGKVDFAAACISITDERCESVNFSDPYFICGTVMAVLKADATAAAGDEPAGLESASLWDTVRASFEKTFIREDRWKLFSRGVNVTLLITILAIISGTALGFVVFMLCRKGNPVANGVTRFCLWLVQGMPMVVLLMILYYIVFSSVAINGVAVAVIGFTLTFGAAVFGLLKMGVGAVDVGQYEAAYALGHSSRQTFFRIILPQAIPHIMPAYKGEIVGLIKATAVVGYIAVQDLTKMGDIVRSRTYEAFFPLIAVTIIYFLLEGLLGTLVRKVNVNIDPKKRSRAAILKGVNTGDQN